MKSSRLNHRGVISIKGDDARNFLQGLITNDVNKVREANAVYACFLTPQGKYLADFFLYEQENGLLLEIDKSLLPDLLKRLTMYKLRSRVELADVSDKYSIGVVWDTEQPRYAFADPRISSVGFRLLNAADLGDDDYALWQMQNGLPDRDDFERERTSMLEANLDKLNAISWDKGCYMGQELTARTHYRGLIKKRFLPLELSVEQDLAKDAPVMRDNKTIGFIRRSHKNYAMALITLEALESGLDCMVDDVDARIIIPKWFL